MIASFPRKWSMRKIESGGDTVSVNAVQAAVVGRSRLRHLRIHLEGHLPPRVPIADPRPRNVPLLVRQGERAGLVGPPVWPWACADRLAHSEH